MSLKGNFTAEVVTFARAVGAGLKDPAVKNNDYLAREFLNSGFRLGLHGWMPHVMELAYHLVTPGCYLYLHMRCRVIDKIVENAAAEGFSQFVIIGAGLDSRPYRYRDKLKDVRIFELDHPMTARLKQARLRRWGGDFSHVTYVDIDLAQDSLEKKLTQAGFDFGAKSILMAEGLVYYLQESTVFRMLESLVRVATGSILVFDYVIKAAHENPASAYGGEKIVRYLQRKNEPIQFSIDPDKIDDLLRPFGFHVISNDTAASLAPRYLRQSNGKMLGRVCEIYGIVHARHG